MINAVVWTDLDDNAVGMEEGFDAQPVFEHMRPRELKEALAYIKQDLKTAASAQAGGWISGTTILDDIFPRAVKLVINPNLLEVLKFVEKNDLGWYCSVKGQDVLTWYSERVSRKAANTAVDALLGEALNKYTNLVPAWETTYGKSFNLALWLEQASHNEVEELWKSKVQSQTPSQVFFSGPIALDILGWMALRYHDLEQAYYKAKMGSKNVTIAVEKKPFEHWLTDGRHLKLAQNAVDFLLGESEAEEFIGRFNTAWHFNYKKGTGGWLIGHWFRGFQQVGDQESMYLTPVQIRWLEDYANWLDKVFPFEQWKATQAGGEWKMDTVDQWFEAATSTGWQKKYRKQPAGRNLPDIRVDPAENDV